MASIPCAAYQASSIHGNLRRQHRHRHDSTSSTGSGGAGATPPASPLLPRPKAHTLTSSPSLLPPPGSLSEEKKGLFGSLSNLGHLKMRSPWIWSRSQSHPEIDSAPNNSIVSSLAVASGGNAPIEAK